MSGFKFRLEKVLNYKETVEGFKKSEYGSVNQKLNEEKKTLQEYCDYKSDLIKSKEDSQKTNIANLKLFNNYIGEISKNIQEQENIVENTKKELEHAKEELLLAIQEKKSFEKLKEKDYEEFIAESKKEEAKIVDEIVTFKSGAEQ